MSRILANILLIVMIAYTAMAIPINTELFNWDLNFDFNIAQPSTDEPVEEVPEEPAPVEHVTTTTFQVADQAYNEALLQYEITSTMGKDALKAQDIPQTFALTIYLGDQVIKKVPLGELGLAYDVDGTTPGQTTLKGENLLTGDTLGLDYGHYTIAVLTDDQEQARFAFSNWPSTTFASPSQTTASGKRMIQLWFEDPTGTYLLPVHREVPIPDNTIRTVLNALRDGASKSSGLSKDAPAPYVPVARYSNGAARLYMDKYSNQPFVKDTESVSTMTTALIQTVTSINFVDTVTFYVDKKQNNSDLLGFDMSKRYTYDQSPSIWYPLLVNDSKVYLVPMTLEATTVEEVVAKLKTGHRGQEGSTLPGSIPSSVDLVQAEVSGKTAYLTFNQALLSAYDQDLDAQKMMIHSILNSVTALEGIDQVVFYVEGIEEGALFGFPMGAPLTPYPYVNMEL